MQVQPYLFFDGRCEEAIEFYRKTLGAEVGMMMRWKDSPEPCPEGTIPPGSENKVMHAAIKIGGTTVMASDGHCTGAPSFQGFSLSLDATDDAACEAAVRCFERRRAGAGAADQDILCDQLRHGRRSVRRVVDGDQTGDVNSSSLLCRGVAFTANLERHLSCPVQTVPGDTVRAVLDGVFAAQPRLRSGTSSMTRIVYGGMWRSMSMATASPTEIGSAIRSASWTRCSCFRHCPAAE